MIETKFSLSKGILLCIAVFATIPLTFVLFIGGATGRKGLLRVVLEEGKYVLHQEQTEAQEQTGELTLLLKDGVLHKAQTLSDIKNTYQQ